MQIYIFLYLLYIFIFIIFIYIYFYNILLLLHIYIYVYAHMRKKYMKIQVLYPWLESSFLGQKCKQDKTYRWVRHGSLGLREALRS